VRRLSPATGIAVVALFISLSGTAYAATGGSLMLGRANTASGATELTSKHGTALRLYSPVGVPPLAVGNSVEVKNLNVGYLDGQTWRSFISVEMARISSIPSESSCTRMAPCTWQSYGAPDGITTADANRSDVQMLSPTEPMVMRDLSVRMTSSLSPADAYVSVQVNNGVNTPGGAEVSCEISDGMACSSPVAVQVPAYSLLSISILEVQGTPAIPQENVLVTYVLGPS
jgi:hypothetical protein